MSIRFLGGIITNNAIQPTTSYAKGIWTLSQQSQAKYSNTWPSPVPLDAQFNYVTALLNGDGVNGAQNNTFVDSSSNNFTITRYGNTTQGSFSPYGPNWSNNFNATGQYLSVPYSSAFNLTGDFTIEFWINPGNLPSSTGSAAQSYERIFSFGTYNAANSLGLEINSNDSANVRKLISWYNGTGYPVSANNAVAPKLWYHIAMVRSGTTITTYINGTSTGVTITGASAAVNTSQSFYIASLQGFEADSSAAYNGYISNFRIVKGTAVYTANFTPPTSPLTAISGTSLLTCQSNYFIDTSSNAFAITANGSPSVQRFNPFGTASAYTTIVNGGSGYFDGTGDYLNIASNAAFDFGSSDVTIEAWVYLPSVGIQQIITAFPAGPTAGTGWAFGTTSNNYLILDVFVGSTEQVVIANSNPISTNQWNHVVYTRSGGTNRLFVNGNLCTTSSNTLTQAINTGGNSIYIARSNFSGYTYPLTGYISNLRVVKGTAVYTANFTPPTAPLTAVAGTSLLLLTTNAGIYDSAMMNDYETIDNTQVSTAIKKFGTASIYFDGAGDALSSPSQPIYNFGTGNFTIEMWVNRAGAGTGDRFLVSRSNGADFLFRWTAGGVLQFHIASTVIAAYTWTFTTGTWYHLAAVRNGSTVTIYIDGTSVATGTNSTNMSSTAPLLIGGYPPTSSDYFNGYIDDLRITNCIARYTANFTPPTASFPTAGP